MEYKSDVAAVGLHLEDWLCTMMVRSGILVCTAIIVIGIASTNGDDLQPIKGPVENEQTDRVTRSNNDIVGVASIAGITSRNGRISSLGGIQFFPGPESIITNRDAGFYYPLTVASEKDGRYASGTVQVYPGSRGVAASASAGYMPGLKDWPNNRQMFNDIILQPSQIFQARNFDPWFPKPFKNFSPTPDVLRNAWLYPSFNPFVNFWR